MKIIKYDLFWAAILLCCLLLFSLRFLPLWFTVDDTSCIFASTLNPVKLFSDSDTYLLFNKMFYTPLLPLSFKLDFVFFGLDPLGYHIHNLFAAFVTGLIGYRVCRFYLPRFESWVCAYFFLISHPVISNISWITRRHYLWGTFFFLLAVFFFKKAEAKKSYPFSAFSNIFYFVALLFKEAFAPLPAVIFLIAKGSFRDRIAQSVPYCIVLGCYLLMRLYILGGLGGYIEGDAKHELFGLIKNIFLQLNVFSSAVWGLNIGIILLLFVLFFIIHRKRAMVMGCLFITVSSPFLLIENIESNSHLFHYFPAKLMLPHFVISLLLAYLLFTVKNRTMKFFSYVIVVFFFSLQVMNAQSIYAYLNKSSETYKKLTMETYSKNEEGRNVLVLFSDAIFYNYYYAAIAKASLERGEEFGAVITLSSHRDGLILNKQDLDGIDSLYRNGTWVDAQGDTLPFPDYSINETLAMPQLKVRQKGQFFSVDLIDDRDGEFHGILKTTFSDHNIGVQSVPLPKGASFRIGLVRGKEIAYIMYCTASECSKPFILNPVGDENT